MFTYDTFLDLFTLVMLDDQIVFVCDNSNILSHTIYLFAEILTKPFKYAHPVVTILLDDEDWLHATGPVIYGMLKKRKVVEERRIVERYDKTYVFLSPDKVEVLYAEDRKALLKRRPTKLVMIKDLFRDLKKSRKKEPRTTKYEIETNEYCIMASKEEKEHSVAIINHVNEFVLEEIIKKLPSQLEIENIRSRMDPSSVPQDKDYDSHFVKVICSNIRKHNKDSFLEKFIETQTLNNYLFA